MIAAYSPARSLFRPSMSACLSKAMLCPPLCAAALLPNEPTDHRVACATPRGWYVLRWVQSVWLHPLRDRKPLRYRLEALARRIGPGPEVRPRGHYSQSRLNGDAQGTYPDR